jgi:hypothetical protein
VRDQVSHSNKTVKIIVIFTMNFSLLHRVQTGSGAHPAFYSTGTGSSFPGGKAIRA